MDFHLIINRRGLTFIVLDAFNNEKIMSLVSSNNHPCLFFHLTRPHSSIDVYVTFHPCESIRSDNRDLCFIDL